MIKFVSIFAVYMVLAGVTNFFVWRFFQKNLQSSSKTKKRTYFLLICYHTLLLTVSAFLVIYVMKV